MQNQKNETGDISCATLGRDPDSCSVALQLPETALTFLNAITVSVSILGSQYLGY